MRATPWVTESPSPEIYFGPNISADAEAPQIPDSPDGTTPELSPLVNLVFFPDVPLAPTDHPKLELLFGGQMVAPSWNDEKEHAVNNFIEDHPRETNLQLIVKWFPSSPAVDPCGHAGAEVFKLLFDRLTRFVSVKDNPVCRALAGFERIDVTLPQRAEEAGIDPTRQMPGEHRAIDLRSAPNLREFSFTGSFLTLTKKFTLTSLGHLTKLSLTACRISVNDTLALLQSGFQLKVVEFETIFDEDDCEAGRRLTFAPGARCRPPLKTVWITACTDVSSILRWFDWQAPPAVTLTVLAHGTRSADQNLMATVTSAIGSIRPKTFILKGTFLQNNIDDIRDTLPGVIYHQLST